MVGDRASPQSEVIRAVLLDDSPCCAGRTAAKVCSAGRAAWASPFARSASSVSAGLSPCGDGAAAAAGRGKRRRETAAGSPSLYSMRTAPAASGRAAAAEVFRNRAALAAAPGCGNGLRPKGSRVCAVWATGVCSLAPAGHEAAARQPGSRDAGRRLATCRSIACRSSSFVAGGLPCRCSCAKPPLCRVADTKLRPAQRFRFSPLEPALLLLAPVSTYRYAT